MVCICPNCGTFLSTTTSGYICYKCGWTNKQSEAVKPSFDSVPCKYCGNNPANGGSGICFCTLGLNEIRS